MELCRNILTYLKDKELENENDYLYYVNTEYDSNYIEFENLSNGNCTEFENLSNSNCTEFKNLYNSNCTEFEKLSNGNFLVFKSKLEPILCLLIVNIFNSIYDDNYLKFENYEDLTSSPDSIFSWEDCIKMDLINSDNYMQFIMAYLCNNLDFKLKINNNNEKFIANVDVFNFQQNVKYNIDGKKQKVFEIVDILNLLNN